MTKGSPTITIRLPLLMKAKLVELAERDGATVTDFVRCALSDRMMLRSNAQAETRDNGC
jgi:predicted DNA-binding protein